MDFELTDQQKLMRDSLRTFLTRECLPDYVRACDDEERFPFELYDKLDALKTVAAMLGMEKPKEVKHIGEIEHNHNHGVTPEIKEILDAFLVAGREV